MNPVLKSTRLPFLVLTPICVFLGASTAIAQQGDINGGLLALILVGALLAHIAVNTLNEYSDFKSGLDLLTVKTPFSGGSGSLPGNPQMTQAVLFTGLMSCAGVVLIGLFFLWHYGWGLLPIGLLGLLIVVTYTQWINKHPWLCLLAPGMGFGFLMVMGTQFVLTGHYTFLSCVAASVPFFLANNLLLLNQFPDIRADITVGRNHLPIAYGTGFSALIYLAFAATTVGIVLTAVLSELFPVISLIALFPIPLSLFAFIGAVTFGERIGKQPQYLAANVSVAVLSPLLLGIALLIG